MALPEKRQNLPRKRRVIRAQVKTKQIDRKKAEEKRIKKRRTSFLEKFINISLGFTIFLGVSLTVFSYNKVSSINGHYKELRAELMEKQATQGFYLMGLESYSSPQYIENTARASLGMDYPTENQFLRVKKDEGIKQGLLDRNSWANSTTSKD